MSYSSNGPAFLMRENMVDDQFRIYLPHSCDEWEIGDVNEVTQMIADLMRLKALLAAGPTPCPGKIPGFFGERPCNQAVEDPHDHE